MEEKKGQALRCPYDGGLLLSSLADGVLLGSCEWCHENVVRINPRTGVEEWLDGKSPWAPQSLRPVVRQEHEDVA